MIALGWNKISLRHVFILVNSFHLVFEFLLRYTASTTKSSLKFDFITKNKSKPSGLGGFPCSKNRDTISHEFPQAQESSFNFCQIFSRIKHWSPMQILIFLRLIQYPLRYSLERRVLDWSWSFCRSDCFTVGVERQISHWTLDFHLKQTRIAAALLEKVTTARGPCKIISDFVSL